jgi:hypothetical protein
MVFQNAQRPSGAQNEGPECLDIPWKCSRCEGLLGYVDSGTRTVVRLKYKDSYVWIGQPEWLRVVCRSCAAVNEIVDPIKVEENTAAAAAEAEKASPDATEEGTPK